MARGGRREGAGRPTGGKGLTFRWDKVAAAIEMSPDKTPLAHLIAVMQNEAMKDSVRLQAAIAAAPYVHPKLSSVEIKGDAAAPMKVQSEIGQALASLAELMRQRKTIDGDVVDVDERPTGRGEAAKKISAAPASQDRMAQPVGIDGMAGSSNVAEAVVVGGVDDGNDGD